MTSCLLQEILDDLEILSDDPSIAVAEVALGAPFIAVRLTSGWIGSSLNFPVQDGDRYFDPRAARQACLSQRRTDPLLRRWASSSCSMRAGAATAVATALSQPHLHKHPPGPLRVERVASWQRHLAERVMDTDRVCQIGFGGSVDLFARPGSVSRFVVFDLAFADAVERTRARKILRERKLEPRNVELRHSALESDALETSDVVCISGSTLCNGTLDGLLARIPKGRLVVLQGPSCSIYAPSLFRRGVSLVYAPIKRQREWELALRGDPGLIEYVDGDYVVLSPSLPM